MARLWEKGGDLDMRVLRYTVGDDPVLDARLVPFDARASAAHARMLAECGHLPVEDAERLAHALEEIARAHAAGEWSIEIEDEDVHTAIERQLIERLGPLGGAIHLARSRNDQVLAALRLYLREIVAELASAAESVATALDEIAARQGDIPLPGYTHLQRAMPSSVALWAGAYASEVRDDAAGLARTRARIDRNPLGSAAGYGVPVIEIDRARTAELLDFAEVQEPVTAVQLSRGKAEAAVAFELHLLLQDLGRLASDVVLFATAEFGFLRLPERFTTGSSIMPQKRNPDLFELVRGRAAQSAGDLHAILALPAKLPSGYHRDLQLIKGPLFRVIDAADDTLAILAHALPGLEFDRAAAASADEPALHATGDAYRLVRDEGIPFREAYRRVAAQLRAQEAGGKPLP